METFSEISRQRDIFYKEIEEELDAEFINGAIVIRSPVKYYHLDYSINLATLINVYVTKFNLGVAGFEKMLITLPESDYEPDICFYKKNKSDIFIPNQLKFPPPDFVVEIISETTEAIDRGKNIMIMLPTESRNIGLLILY